MIIVGEIQINKSPLKQVDLSRFIQEKTAIVEQEPYLLSDSLKKHILCKTLGEEKEEIIVFLLCLGWMIL